jgi:hypothetical protein
MSLRDSCALCALRPSETLNFALNARINTIFENTLIKRQYIPKDIILVLAQFRERPRVRILTKPIPGRYFGHFLNYVNRGRIRTNCLPIDEYTVVAQPWNRSWIHREIMDIYPMWSSNEKFNRFFARVQ